MEGLSAGADAYLTKPLDLDEIRLRLKSAFRIINSQTGQASNENTGAFHEEEFVNNLWSEKAIHLGLRRELAFAQREDTSFGVTLIKINNIKLLLDKYDKEVEEAYIKEVAVKLISSLRL